MSSVEPKYIGFVYKIHLPYIPRNAYLDLTMRTRNPDFVLNVLSFGQSNTREYYGKTCKPLGVDEDALVKCDSILHERMDEHMKEALGEKMPTSKLHQYIRLVCLYMNRNIKLVNYAKIIDGTRWTGSKEVVETEIQTEERRLIEKNHSVIHGLNSQSGNSRTHIVD